MSISDFDMSLKSKCHVFEHLKEHDSTQSARVNGWEMSRIHAAFESSRRLGDTCREQLWQHSKEHVLKQRPFAAEDSMKLGDTCREEQLREPSKEPPFWSNAICRRRVSNWETYIIEKNSCATLQITCFFEATAICRRKWYETGRHANSWGNYRKKSVRSNNYLPQKMVWEWETLEKNSCGNPPKNLVLATAICSGRWYQSGRHR